MEGGSALSTTPEIRDPASGSADELFQRWELAMQQRFEEKLKLRLKSEPEHCEHQADVLPEQVDQRAWGAFEPGGRRIIGEADGYATWERERKLGADLDESTVTVDQQKKERWNDVPKEDAAKEQRRLPGAG